METIQGKDFSKKTRQIVKSAFFLCEGYFCIDVKECSTGREKRILFTESEAMKIVDLWVKEGMKL